MITKTKSVILDDILRRFKGNETIYWKNLQDEFANNMNEYYIIENNINYLVGDGMLIRDKATESLTMTDMGFAVYTDIDNLGYVTKQKAAKKKFWNKAIGFNIMLLTFLLIVYTSFFQAKPSVLNPVHDTIRIVPQMPNSIPRDTTKQPGEGNVVQKITVLPQPISPPLKTK